jgi:hypothetical protein
MSSDGGFSDRFYEENSDIIVAFGPEFASCRAQYPNNSDTENVIKTYNNMINDEYEFSMEMLQWIDWVLVGHRRFQLGSGRYRGSAFGFPKVGDIVTDANGNKFKVTIVYGLTFDATPA